MGSVGPRRLPCSWSLLVWLSCPCLPRMQDVYLSYSLFISISLWPVMNLYSSSLLVFFLAFEVAPVILSTLFKCENLIHSIIIYKAGFCSPLIDWPFPSSSGSAAIYTPSVNTSWLLCVLFPGVAAVVRQLDFNLPLVPVNYIKSGQTSPRHTAAAVRRAPAPSTPECAAVPVDVTWAWECRGSLLERAAPNCRAASAAMWLNSSIPVLMGNSWQQGAWELLRATCAPYPPWRVMLWQPGVLRESWRRLDSFCNVVVGGLGLRESHDKETEREHFHLLIYARNMCVTVTERSLHGLPVLLWVPLHVCGWIRPDQNIPHPLSLIAMLAGATFLASGTMNSELYLQNSTRHCQDICLWSESHGTLGCAARREHTWFHQRTVKENHEQS